MIEIFINLKNAKSANSCEKIEKIENIKSTISSVKNPLKFFKLKNTLEIGVFNVIH